MKPTLFNGLLFGCLIGGVAGLLRTPQTGKQNREKLKQYIEGTTEHVEDVSNKVSDLKDAVTELSNQSKQFSSTFMKEMNETVQSFTYEAEPRIRRMQDQTKKLQTDINDLSQSMGSDE